MYLCIEFERSIRFRDMNWAPEVRNDDPRPLMNPKPKASTIDIASTITTSHSDQQFHRANHTHTHTHTHANIVTK